MIERFFDFEVYPNWWCCVFGDMPDNKIINNNVKETFNVVTSDDDYSRDNLIKYLKENNYVCMGFNIKHYDLCISNAVYQGFNPQQIRIINDLIIRPDLLFNSKEALRLSPFAKKKYTNLVYEDLKDDVGSMSLKEIEAILGLDIMETSVPFDKVDLTEEDKQDIIKYCKQDVYASMVYFDKIVRPYCETKLLIGKHHNIDEKICYKSTNAQAVALALGAKRSYFPDSEKIDFQLPVQIKEYCYENLPSKIVDKILTSTDGFEIELFDNIVSFGNGGIHSVYSTNLYVESDANYALVNIDAASYYPSIMIQFNLLSRAVKNPKVFKAIFDERIAIKHKPIKTADDEEINMADKLILNTTFGASGNKYLDLYDPYMCTQVCRVGQILLGAFANKLYKSINSAKIIQTNTDGILVYVKRSELSKVISLMNEWTAVSNIQMELEDVQKIWQRDVNNYVMVELDKGKEVVKSRGAWLKDITHRIGGVRLTPLSAFVCSKAAKEFLIHGTDILTSIIQNTNLSDFIMTCTKGPSYRTVVHRMADGTEIELYKANRVIATKDTKYGRLYKIKYYKDKISYTQMPNTPENCLTMNYDLDSYNFNEIRKQIDYMYYVNRTIDLLDIEWQQLLGDKLFKIDKFNVNFD